MGIDLEKYFVHDNSWWWGVSYNIICKDGNGIVEVQFDREMPNTCYVKGLSVSDSHRQQGIGKELILLCESIARQEKMQFLELSVEKGNGWLFEWYKRMGFRVLRIEDNVFDMIKVL